MKSIISHAVLLGIAGVLAFGVWSRDDKADKEKSELVEVWSGSGDRVQAVSYETKQRTVKIEPKQDAVGRWYVVHLDREVAPPPPSPHGAAPNAPAPGTPPKREQSSFVGVKEADELVKKLGDFKAVRSLGKLGPARAADFGFDKPEGTLKVKEDGKEHVLTIGAQTPGGGERYAKYGPSGEVFAIDGDLLQSLTYADTRLMTRDLHAFSDDDVKRVRVIRGAKSRELTKLPDKKDAWADAATPTKADETLVNWMTKLDRVRPLQYEEKPDPAPRPDQLVVRVEYLNGSKNLGFFELYKLGGDKPEYWVRSELTRWYAKVVSGPAEQLDHDLAAILK